MYTVHTVKGDSLSLSLSLWNDYLRVKNNACAAYAHPRVGCHIGDVDEVQTTTYYPLRIEIVVLLGMRFQT